MRKVKEPIATVYASIKKNGDITFYGYLEASNTRMLIEPIKGEINQKGQQAYKVFMEG